MKQKFDLIKLHRVEIPNGSSWEEFAENWKRPLCGECFLLNTREIKSIHGEDNGTSMIETDDARLNVFESLDEVESMLEKGAEPDNGGELLKKFDEMVRERNSAKELAYEGYEMVCRDLADFRKFPNLPFELRERLKNNEAFMTKYENFAKTSRTV